MKIRVGFVSNSSSSSFICDVCGAEYSGIDISLSDYDMCICENYHHFHKHEAVNVNKPYSFTYNNTEYTYDNFEDAYESDCGEIPNFYCPICNMKTISYRDAVSYLLKKNNYKSLEEVKNEILQNYSSYNELKKDITGIKQYDISKG